MFSAQRVVSIVSSNSWHECKCQALFYGVYDFPAYTVSPIKVLLPLSIKLYMCLFAFLTVCLGLWGTSVYFCALFMSWSHCSVSAAFENSRRENRSCNLKETSTCIYRKEKNSLVHLEPVQLLISLNSSPCINNTQPTLSVLIRTQWREEHVFSAQRYLYLCCACFCQPTRHRNRISDSFWLHSLGSIDVWRQLTWEMSVNERTNRWSRASAKSTLIRHPAQLWLPPLLVW